MGDVDNKAEKCNPVQLAMGMLDLTAERVLAGNPAGALLYGKFRPRLEGLAEDIFRPVEKHPRRKGRRDR